MARARLLRALVLGALLLLPLLPLPAQAADPGRAAWSPHDPIAVASGLAIAADGSTIAATFVGPFTRASGGTPAGPRTDAADLIVYNAETGPAHSGQFTTSGTSISPAGRNYTAVNRTGEVVVTLGYDRSTATSTPPGIAPLTTYVEFNYLRVPAGMRWGESGASPTVLPQAVAQTGTPAGLLVSADGTRAVVAINQGATFLVRGYTYDTGRLVRAFDYTSTGNVSALAGTQDLSQILVVANVNENGVERGFVALVGYDGRASYTHYDRRVGGNTTLASAVMTRDGARFAAGGLNGTLLTFDNRGAATPAPVVTTLGNETVSVLAVSGDGSRLGAALGNATHHLDFTTSTPSSRWVYRGTGNVTSLSYNLTGGLVMAAVHGVGALGFGDDDATPFWTMAPSARHVAINDAGTLAAITQTAPGGQQHTVSALVIQRNFVFEFAGGAKEGPTTTAGPDGSARFEVVLRNTGAAPESFRFEPTPGASVALRTDPEAPTLRPGEVRRITLIATPGRSAPGDLTFNVSAIAASTGAFDNVTLTTRTAPRFNVTLFYDGPTEIAAAANVSTTLLLGITNDGNSDAAVGIRASQAVTRGEPWAVAVDPPSFTLSPGSLTTARVTLTPPADVPNGTANVVTFTLEGQDVSGTVQVTLRVNPTTGVSLDAQGRARFVEPGRNVTYNVTILNNGTLPRLYETYTQVSATANRNWVADVPTEPFRLEAGANRTFQVRVFAPDDVEPNDRATIVVYARTIPELANETAVVANVTLFANAVAATPTPDAQSEDGRTIPAPGVFLAAAGLVVAVALRRRQTR